MRRTGVLAIVLALTSCTSASPSNSDPDSNGGAAAPESPPASGGSGTDGVGAGTDAGPSADTSPPPGKVAIFMAQGMLGRTMISCDDGNTWVGNRSWELEGDAFLCGIKQTNKRCGGATPCSYF